LATGLAFDSLNGLVRVSVQMGSLYYLYGDLILAQDKRTKLRACLRLTRQAHAARRMGPAHPHMTHDGFPANRGALLEVARASGSFPITEGKSLPPGCMLRAKGPRPM
jgi:hypothetical protein